MRFDPRFICEAAARQVGIPVSQAMKVPAIHFASKTSLQNFRVAVCAMRWYPNDGQNPRRLRRAAAPGGTA